MSAANGMELARRIGTYTNLMPEGSELALRDATPLEGTDISLYETIIPSFWTQNGMNPLTQWIPADGNLAERVWVTNRCIQMNAQQVSSMPLHFDGATPPEWAVSPDPNWYPNGIGDAIFAITEQLYGWGFSCLYITNFYADGYPRNWTVLDSRYLHIDSPNGVRRYKLGETELDPARIVQIDRNPGSRSKGCSAIQAYAQQAWGLLAAGNQSMSISQGSIPFAYLKSQRKLTKDQARGIQAQWMERTQNRNGAPPVLPPEIDVESLSFDPKDLALLDTQEFNAKVLATAFGVPSVLLNMALTGGLTYQNPSALGEMWWRFELRPAAKRIADALTARLLPRGQSVWFDATDTFLPLDASSDEDDTQASTVAAASPGPQPGLSVIGGTG